jgi:hypothetical protein
MSGCLFGKKERAITNVVVAEENPGSDPDPAAMEKICPLLGVRPEDMKLIFYRSPTPRYSFRHVDNLTRIEIPFRRDVKF